MAKPWSAVIQSDEYRSLSLPEQTAAKREYFDTVVAIKPEYQSLPDVEKQAAQKEFLGSASPWAFKAKEIRASKPSFFQKANTPISELLTGKSIEKRVEESGDRFVKDWAFKKGQQGKKISDLSILSRSLLPVAGTVGASLIDFSPAGLAIAGIGGKAIQLAGKTPIGKVTGKLLTTKLGKGRLTATAKEIPYATKETITQGRGLIKKAEQAFKPSATAKATKLSKQATNTYRDILRPTQGEVKNIEIKKGGNIDDYYTLAAKEKLPVKQTADKKLDTEEARRIIVEKLELSSERLSKVLSTDKEKKFDLFKIANKAKSRAAKNIKNASEAKKAAQEIDNFIADEVERYGSNMLTATEANTVKQGMWGVGYDVMKPTSKANARRIGYVIKDIIEKAYPNEQIQNINKLTGDYATLLHLLENAQGRVIKGGRLGGYTAKVIGAMAGSKIPIVGPIAGAMAGDKVNTALYNPVRRAASAASKMSKANRIMAGVKATEPIRLSSGKTLNVPAVIPKPNLLAGKPTTRNIALTPEIMPAKKPTLSLPNINQAYAGKGFTARKPLASDYFKPKGFIQPAKQQKIIKIESEILKKTGLSEREILSAMNTGDTGAVLRKQAELVAQGKNIDSAVEIILEKMRNAGKGLPFLKARWEETR